MAQIQFDATQFAPAIIGTGQLPVSDSHGWPVVIVSSEVKPTKSGTGGYIEFLLQIIEGEHEGDTGAYRVNLFNPSEEAKQIAQRQMSALCYVTGVLKPTDTAQLHNKPFRAIVGLQKNLKEGENYTEVKGVKDIEGDNPSPKKVQAPASSAPKFASQTLPPAPVQTAQVETSTKQAWVPNPEPSQPASPETDNEPSWAKKMF